MAPIVERITDGATILGEGPHWDAQRQTLYYVNIFGKTIHSYQPASNKHAKASVGQRPGFILPVEGTTDQFVVGLERELVVFRWDGNGETASKRETLAEVDNQPKTIENRFNDGKCDAEGRIWAGTMASEKKDEDITPNNGSLYSFGPNEHGLKKHLDKIHVANGLAWSADRKQFFYIDSGTGCIEQFDFDIKNGAISNRRTLFTLKKHNLLGTPDGQTIDTDGNLWVALFGGGKVIKIDSKRSETLLETIDLPADLIYTANCGLSVGGAERGAARFRLIPRYID